MEITTLTLPESPDTGSLHSCWIPNVGHLSENREVYISVQQSGPNIFITSALSVCGCSVKAAEDQNFMVLSISKIVPSHFYSTLINSQNNKQTMNRTKMLNV